MISECRSGILPVVIGVPRVWLAFSLLACISASGFDWTLVKQDGRDYVPLRDVAAFYRFPQSDLSNEVVALWGPTLRLQVAVNSRELYLNGLKFILSFPVIRQGDTVLISRMDLGKLVDPVLRPAKIQTTPAQMVVLDPGHGGYDQGARSNFGNEKDFALDVALRTRDLLLKAGYAVRLTRSEDVFIPLELRAAFASHQLSAIFVSIHFNSGMNVDASGIETYCLAPRGVPSTNDLMLNFLDFRMAIGNLRDAENIALATAMHTSLITRLALPDRGIKRARFVVLRDSAIPAILVEGGFLTNYRDETMIASPSYRQMMAQAILQGIQSYNRAVERNALARPLAHGAPTPPPGTEEAFSIWDPFKSDVYTAPEPIRK